MTHQTLNALRAQQTLKQVLADGNSNTTPVQQPPLNDNIIIIDGPGSQNPDETGSSAPARGISSSVIPYGTSITRTNTGRRRGRGRGGNMQSGNGLPMVSANPVMTFTFRFVCDRSGGGTDVKVSDLARMMVAASTNTSYRYLFRTIKVDNVSIRATPPDLGGSSQVTLQFLGANTNETKYMDQSLRIDHNACLSKKPPRFSIGSFWHDVTTSTDNEVTLFKIQSVVTNSSDAPTGTKGTTYVDIKLSGVFDIDRYLDYTISNNSLNLQAGGLFYGQIGTGTGLELVPVGRVNLGI